MLAPSTDPRQPEPGEPGPARVALTDVFDEQHTRSLVDFPPGFVRWLTITGIFAFVVTALLGYDRISPQRFPDHITLPEGVLYVLDVAFRKPWPLYVFFCALLATLQWSVLRAAPLIRHRRAMLRATYISVAIVGIVYAWRDALHDLISALLPLIDKWIGQTPGRLNTFLKATLTSPWTYLTLNAFLLLLLYGQAVNHWRGRKTGKVAPAPIDLHTGSPVPLPGGNEPPGVLELVASDLILRATLTCVLAILFWFPVISLIVHAFARGVAIQAGNIDTSSAFSICTTSVPGTCVPGFSIEFWALDVIWAGFSLGAGLLLLAFLVQSEAMELVRTQRDGPRQDPLRVGREIIDAFFDILLTPFNLRRPRSRIGRRVQGDLQRSLRALVWPVLVFFGVLGAAILADFLQRSIHCPRFYDTNPAGTRGCAPTPTMGDILTRAVVHGVPMTLGAALMILCPSVALMILFANRRPADNALRFVAWVGLTNALPIALVLLALAVLNGAALFLGRLIDRAIQHGNGSPPQWQAWIGLDTPTYLHPFYPGLFALTFFATLVALGIWVRARSLGRPRLQKPPGA